MSDAPELSVLIPCRNEEANAQPIAAAVIAECEALTASFELIFIDNASTDGTVAMLKALCARDPRIKLIVNTRNFGQMRSPTYGVFQARGRAVIGMCADFQDPPALIPRFVERWRAGADIVLGVRSEEKSPPLLGAMRALSYWFARRLRDDPIVRNATGFGLYDARVVNAIRALNEPEPFFRGLLVETGYKIEQIPYPRPPRTRGRSNNTLVTLVDFALSGLAGSSKRLARLPLQVAVLAALGAVAALVAALVAAVLGGSAGPWLVAGAVEGQFALLFTFLGLIGDQVRLLGERARGTPLVIERERVDFG